MGTSRSSPGAPGGVPLVPPWVPPALPPEPSDNDPGAAPPDPAAPAPPRSLPLASVPLAAPGRFGPARTSLGRFAGSGARRDMQRGLGHYVHKGLGGSQIAARRAGSV